MILMILIPVNSMLSPMALSLNSSLKSVALSLVGVTSNCVTVSHCALFVSHHEL